MSAIGTFALTASALLLTACASGPTEKTLGMSPKAIYADAKDEMANAQWDKAISLLEKVEARAAGTELSQQAELDKIFALYRSDEPAQALVAIERFIKLHPASPALDYALFLKGLVTFNDDMGIFSGISGQDLAERDQKASKESFEAFKELVTRFPDSKYSTDARLRMTYIVNSLAQYEVYVARYYYRRGAYLAAVNRAQTAVTDYPGTPAIEESLYVLYKSYDALGMTDLRDDTKRVFDTNYPNSDLPEKGTKAASSWWKVW
jgi:outer membrane protein assembly factor BamD